jgi:hypothetical protein
MQNKRKELIKAVFVADALSFGAHWVYSTDKLKEEYSGIIEEYRTPMAKFHEGKKAGHSLKYNSDSRV